MTNSIDAMWLSLMHACQQPLLTAAMAAITWLGSLFVLLPLAAWLGWRSQGDGWQRSFLPLAVLGAGGLAKLLKVFFDRPRPDLFSPLITMPSDTSFPSAHAMQVTAFVVAWLVWRGQLLQPLPLTLGVLLVTAVAVSRTYLQVHFLSDILVGIVIGAVWASLFYRLPVWRWS